MTSRWTEFAHRFHEHFTDDPNARVMLGVDRDLGALPDPSLAAADRQLERAEQLRAELEGIVVAPSDFDTTIDWELAHLKLGSQIHQLRRCSGGRRELTQKPTAGDDIGDGIFMVSITDPRPDPERLADITSRMEAVPDYLDALLTRLDTPLGRWVSMDQDKALGLTPLFDSMLLWAQQTSFADTARMQRARDRAVGALSEYRERLGRMAAAEHFSVGLDAAEEIIALRGIPYRARELRQIAADFLRETDGEIRRLRDRLVAKHRLDPSTTVEQLHVTLNERYQARPEGGQIDGIVDLYKTEAARILELIGDNGLFPIPANQEMRILKTPKFLEPSIPAGAMASPAPFRGGKRVSVIYLTVKADRLDDHTLLGIPVMMVHEGIPGHHLQLATAAMHPSVMRRHTDAADHAEGWATMLEDTMLDLGLMGELTDEARFCGKRDISRLGARVAIDLFFMSGDKALLDVGVQADFSSDDPFVAAANLLTAVTGFSEQRAQAELNWYSQARGYPLSYLVGNRMVMNLKRDVRDKAGTDSLAIDRRFHEIYLTSGSMPVRLLRRVFEHQGML
jgi:uncharacterized protein (DUF885 family)